MSTPPYTPGQVWTYRTRPGDEASRLVITRVEPFGDTLAIHVAVTGLAPSHQLSRHIPHLPMSAAALDLSVLALEGSTARLPDDAEGYALWSAAAGRGEAGLFATPLADIIEGALAPLPPPLGALLLELPGLGPVHAGQLFVYKGPRRWWIFPPRLALGLVLDADPDAGVLHVRLLRPAPGPDPTDEEQLETDIGHLPVTLTAFGASVTRLAALLPAPTDAAPTVAEWRGRHRRGEVGAFTTPLWKARRLAWRTAADAAPGPDAPDRGTLEYAFPKPSPSGRVSTVEVALLSAHRPPE